MARIPLAKDTLLGSTTGMINLPKTFHNKLTSAPEISSSEIDNISVSQLLEKDVLHQGFAYKRAANRKTDRVTTSVGNALPVKLQILSKWQLRYLIIYSHYVIYYKDDTGKKPVGWFSLKDYNRVIRAEEMVSTERKWPFKVIGMRASARTWYFCAASEREMKLWMACFKATMDHAIHGKVKQTCLDIITTEQARCPPVGGSHTDDSLTSVSSTTSSIDPHESEETYEDLESPTTNMENDESYDDIATDDDESMSSGGGSGGRFHPPLSSVASANVIYQIETITGTNPNYRDSYFATELDYMDVLSDNDPTEDNYDLPDNDSAHRKLPQPPSRSLSPHNSDEMSTLLENLQKQFPKSNPNTLKDREIRRDPDGTSFRQPMREVPYPKPPDSPKPIQAIKPKPKGARPVIPPGKPVPPKPIPSKSPPAKPPPAPKPIVKSRNLLPQSAIMTTSDKSYAEELLRKHQHNGMYLIRPSGRDASKKVVMVWHDNDGGGKCKHYTIFDDNQNSFALDQTAKFGSLPELIEYYKMNCLPNSDLKLSVPCPG